jgi:NAD-dependent dihydropyrimidine dehydrogenase PreA subunit
MCRVLQGLPRHLPRTSHHAPLSQRNPRNHQETTENQRLTTVQPSTPWYPTIFLDECDGCKRSGKPRCVEYCPNGVFSFENGKANVAHPLNCVNGCHACQPLCHRRAISFPKPAAAALTLPKDPELMRKTTCKSCGKTYWTNRKIDLCIDCEKEK